jgi:hypothetical protein
MIKHANEDTVSTAAAGWPTERPARADASFLQIKQTRNSRQSGELLTVAVRRKSFADATISNGVPWSDQSASAERHRRSCRHRYSYEPVI